MKKQLSVISTNPWVRLVVIPTHRFLSLHDDLGKTWSRERRVIGRKKREGELKRENLEERSLTLSDSLLVVADVVDGGRDFPIQRATNVEEKKKQKRHHHNAEHNPWCRWTHSFLYSQLDNTIRTKQTLSISLLFLFLLLYLLPRH